MDSRSKNNVFNNFEIVATSVLLLVISLFAVWITKTFIGVTSDAVFVSLILIPIVLYLILTGKLREVQAPGGWLIKIEELAKEQVKLLTIDNEKISQIEIQKIEKGSITELKYEMAKITEDKPIILTMIFGRADYYNRNTVLDYIRRLSNYPNFKFIVFTNERGKFLAFTTPTNLKNILYYSNLSDDLSHEVEDRFITKLNFGDSTLFNYNRIITDAIKEDSSYSDALELMSKYYLDTFIVIDKNENIKGVIEGSQIINKIFNALLENK